MRRLAWLALTLVVALACAACSDETSILIEVTSPIAAPEAIDQLDFLVVGSSSGKMAMERFNLDTSWPHSLSVLPADGSEPVLITVTGRKRAATGDTEGAFVVRRVVASAFIDGETQHVSVVLSAECRGIMCPENTDCVGGMCRGVDTDGGVPPDGGDGGPACSCDDGISCTRDTCGVDGGCSNTPNHGICRFDELCNPEMGGCVPATPCDSDTACDDGFFCNGAETCSVDRRCQPGTAPDCADTVDCTTDSCDDTVAMCVHTPDNAMCDDADGCTSDVCTGMAATPCTHTTRDTDGDLHGDTACAAVGGIPADDCDDTLAEVFPGAPEVCNTRDDDCDMLLDDMCTGCGGHCLDATTVTGTGGRFTGTLAAGTETGSCGGGTGSELHYTFDLAAMSDVFITTHGSAVDTVLYVRSCSCGGTEVGCNDDADTLTTSVLQLNGLAPGTYNVFVDSKAAMSASVQMDLYITPTATAGDRCGHPRLLPGTLAMGNTCGAASDATGMCETSDGLNGPDHVYYFVVTGAARNVTFDTCSACNNWDTSIDLRRTCTDAATRVMCDNDTCRSGCASGASRQSRMTSMLSPGLYYVFMDGRGSACGAYNLTTTGL